MRIPPLLTICVMLSAGIIVGHYAGLHDFIATHTPLSVTAISGIVTLVMVSAAAMLRTSDRLATLLLLASTFSLGVFLISNDNNSYCFSFTNTITEYANNCRTRLLTVFSTCGLQHDDYAIVTAMTLGERGMISHDLREAYSISGASHVFALSGMHLGIIYALLSALLPRRLMFVLGRWHTLGDWLLTLLLTITLWAYVVLTGCHPPIIRAAIMLSIYAITRQTARQPRSSSVLIFTLFLMLVIWPEWLFDVGFQMSFMALASIILLFLPLNRRLTDTMPHKWCYTPLRLFLQTMLLSTCAQIGVAPLIAHYFHRFSTYFLLTNLPVPLLATLIIYCAMALLFLASTPFTILTSAAAGALRWLASAQNDYLTWISSLPHASIDNIQINTMQTVTAYAITVCLCMLAYHLRHLLRKRL